MLCVMFATPLRAASRRQSAPDKHRELDDDDKDEARVHATCER